MQCRTLRGFHTTWQSSVESIRKTAFRPGSSEWDWLGTGAYFWIENERMAYLWGNKLARLDCVRAATDPLMVMTCRIELGNCLNLADSADVSDLQRYIKKVKDEGVVFTEENKIPPSGHPLGSEKVLRFLDHKIIDGYDDYTGNLTDTVFGVFNNGRPIYPNSNILVHNSIQLAVRAKAVGGIVIEHARVAHPV